MLQSDPPTVGKFPLFRIQASLRQADKNKKLYELQDAVRGGPDIVPVVSQAAAPQEAPEDQNWRVRCRCRLM